MRLQRTAPLILLAAVTLLAAPSAPAKPPDAPWPCFHGPNHDNISTETGLLKTWPKDGPKLLWSYDDLGHGHASVSIADGRLYTVGDFKAEEDVLALSLDGTLLWKTPHGKAWRGPVPGCRATPTWCEGRLYHMNPTGRLAAFEADTGKEVWSVDLVERFGATWGTWGLSENVTIDGDRILCAPGGPQGRVVALDRTNGKTIWANTKLDQIAAYCTPQIITHNGVRQMITILQKRIVSVDVKTGKLLWSHPHTTKNDQNVTMPLIAGDTVYASSGHGTGGRLLKIAPDSRSVTELWYVKAQDNCHGGVILVDGCLYGCGCRLSRRGLVCVDLATGKMLWSERGIGKVSLTWADGRLYAVTERGLVSLLDVSRKGMRLVGRFSLPRKSRRSCYAHPVVCGGRLYLRHDTQLFAYDIAAASH